MFTGYKLNKVVVRFPNSFKSFKSILAYTIGFKECFKLTLISLLPRREISSLL
jgi:hypothetical protein